MKTPGQLQLKKSPVQSRSRMTLDSLLECGAALLKEAGYEAMTVERITIECGVSVGTFYEYFQHKDALLAELRRRHNEMINDRLATILRTTEGSVEQVVRALVTANIELHAVDPELHHALTVTYSDVGVDRADVDATRRFVDAPYDLFSTLLADRFAIDRRQAKQVANVVVVILGSLTHAAIIEGKLRISSDLLVNEITHVIMGYFDRTLLLLSSPSLPPSPSPSPSAEN